MKYLVWLAVICLLVPVSASAQSVPEQSASNLADETGPWVQTDPAKDTILEVQRMSKELPQEPKSAKEKLEKWMEEKGWEKWDSDTKCLFVIGVAAHQFEDPSVDQDFLGMRSILALGAMLDAKSQIIEFIGTSISGKDQLTIPGTDIYKELGAENNRLEREIEIQRKEVAELVKLVDQRTAEVLEGATNEDRAQAAFAAAIKKLDATYSDEKVEEAKRKKLEEVKKAHEMALGQLRRLEQKAENLHQGRLLRERSSMVRTLASGPLFGAIVLNQAESWIKETGEYQVAVLSIWSPKMAREAKAFATGENYRVKPIKESSTDMSASKWLKTLELESAIGARQFLDGSGKRWLIGIGAQPIGKTSFSKDVARGIAESDAKHAIASSIFADVKSQDGAARVAREYGTEDMSSAQLAKSYNDFVSAEYDEMMLRGLLELTGKTYTHPISQQEIYVSVYGLNPDSAQAAYSMLVTNNAALLEYLVDQTYEKGREEARRLAIAGAKDDPTAFRKGLKDGTAELSEAIGGKTTKTTEVNSWQYKPTPSGDPQEGVFGGDEDVKDNFR